MERVLCLPFLLFFSVNAASAQDMNKTRASEFGLRGPVKQCIERTTYPAGPGRVEQRSTTTLSFAPNGDLLAMSNQFGDYPAQPSYDRAQNGSTVANEQSLDSQGRKVKVQKLPKYENRPNTAIGAISWEKSEVHFSPPSEGTLTTILDEQGRPKEGELRDASGTLTLRIVRTYDEQGRVKGDKATIQHMDTALPGMMEENEGLQSLTPDQRGAMAALMTLAFNGGESSFKYDNQGRVIEKHVKQGEVLDTLTKLAYNEHGDISEETVTTDHSSPLSGGFQMDDNGKVSPGKQTQERPPKEVTTTTYTYEYDARGNWFSKKIVYSNNLQPGADSTSTAERTLTYY